MEQDAPVRTPTLSVIVRLWGADEGGKHSPSWGEAEHVRTGERHSFRTYEALVALLERWCWENGVVPGHTN